MDGRLIIGGERIETPTKLTSTNPATLEPLGEVSLARDDECRRAIEAAKAAERGWRELPIAEKKKTFLRAKDILLARAGELAELVCREKGSPIVEANAVDVITGLEILDYYGRHLDKVRRPRKTRLYQPLLAHKKSSFPVPAAGRDAHHLPLELSVCHPVERRDERPGGREHGRPQAVLDDAVDRPVHRRDLPGSGAPARRSQRRQYPGRAGGIHDHPPHGPDGHVHRERRDRAPGHGACVQELDPHRPRTRRQGSDDRPRRRRPGTRGAGSGLGGVHEHRPELCLDRARLCGREDRGAVHEPGPRSGPVPQGGRSDGRGYRRRPDDDRGPAEDRRGAHRRRPGKGSQDPLRRRKAQGLPRIFPDSRGPLPASTIP